MAGLGQKAARKAAMQIEMRPIGSVRPAVEADERADRSA